MTAAASAPETVIGAEAVREKETAIATATTTEETMTEEIVTEEIVIEETTTEKTVIGIEGTTNVECLRLPGPDREKIPETMKPAGARSNRSMCMISGGSGGVPLNVGQIKMYE